MIIKYLKIMNHFQKLILKAKILNNKIIKVKLKFRKAMLFLKKSFQRNINLKNNLISILIHLHKNSEKFKIMGNT